MKAGTDGLETVGLVGAVRSGRKGPVGGGYGAGIESIAAAQEDAAHRLSKARPGQPSGRV